MKCVSPPALDDRQLLAYIDGEANAAIAAHLEACSYCRERAQALARLQDGLKARLYRLACPAPEELGDYQLGLLPGDQRVRIAQHLRECPHCTLEITQLRDYLGEPDQPFVSEAWGRVKVLVARLVGERGEAGNSQIAPALRGTDQGPVTLEADGVLIVLDIQPTARGGLAIQGQVAAEDQDRWTGAQVELRQSGELRKRTTIDEMGTFHFDGVLPEPAELQLLPEDGPMVVANLQLHL